MANTANRIHSKGTFAYEEYPAGEADIMPGMLLRLTSTGTVIKHDLENGRCEKMFAQEDYLQGKTVEDLYALANPVGCIIPNLGSEVYGRLENDQVVAIGDWLMSRGNGLLKNGEDLDSAVEDYFMVGTAMEAKDLTDSADDNELIRLRVGCH